MGLSSLCALLYLKVKCATALAANAQFEEATIDSYELIVKQLRRFCVRQGTINGSIDGDVSLLLLFSEDVDVLADEMVCRFIVTAIPHIFDSVILTTLSFGLLGSHIAAFCCGVIDGIFAWP